MLEAVARRKAHWLFSAGSEKSFSGKRRPQENMVTSAVFGSIRLMSPEDRFRAIELLLGRDAFEASGFEKDHVIEIELWPRLAGPNERQYVEPDVLLKAGGKTTIIEVKWHAPLSERQLEQQIAAVGEDNVTSVVMLGEAGIDDQICSTRAFRRTWRDVSGQLQQSNAEENTSLDRWIATMRAFLQETDMGRVFGGLPQITEPGRSVFQFSKSGHPPWFDQAPKGSQPVRYTFEGKQ